MKRGRRAAQSSTALELETYRKWVRAGGARWRRAREIVLAALADALRDR